MNATEGPAPGTAPSADQPQPTNDEKTWAMFAHLGAVIGNFLGGWGWIVALVMYLIKKDESKFVAFHALQSLFLQLAVAVALIASIPLMCVVVGFITLPVVAIGALIYAILIAIKAHRGEWAEYWLVGRWARGIVVKPA